MSTYERPAAPGRILVVILADLGDLLLATPALRALRQKFPTARIDLVTTPTGAKVLGRDENQEPRTKNQEPRTKNREPGSSRVGRAVAFGVGSNQGLCDQVIVFEKHRFDTPRDLLRPGNYRYLVNLWRRLRRGSYDACIILRHLSTWFGTLKYAALAAASGAPRRYGLDNGRGFFLTDRVRDRGFGAQHEVDYWLAVVGLLGARLGSSTPTFNVSSAAQHRAEEHLANVHGAFLVLHPGSGLYAPARRWPVQRWAALADHLIADGHRIVLVGGREEAELRRAMLSAMRSAEGVTDLGGRTSVEELAAVLQRCTLFVGNDSGVAHIAGSVGTPVATVFGPTDPRAWGPYGGAAWHVEQRFSNGVFLAASGPHRALKADIACSPCIYRGQRLGTPAGCPDRTCLLRIDVAQVLALVRQRLQELDTRVQSPEASSKEVVFAVSSS